MLQKYSLVVECRFDTAENELPEFEILMAFGDFDEARSGDEQILCQRRCNELDDDACESARPIDIREGDRRKVRSGWIR